ncbi:UNVERIFIED_CONTAM: hypothetical protein Sangu_0422900 [Sesamum angustifolium]|uniref:Ty3 transposon capsid-like protein domain-containing protein n=1 Tax=Sesamum angustifolium TaxID=2727405 RepID=A0AAW2QU97_9LAMI
MGQSISGGYTYFLELISTIGEDQKVPLASVHLEGKADVWFQGSMEGKGSLSWQEFVSAVLERFEDLDCEKVMGKFSKLQQETTVNAYLDKFEELNSYMMEFNKDLNEELFVMKFISGLRKDIKGLTSTMKPKTLNQAIILAKNQEATADAMVKRVNHLQTLHHLTKPPFRSQNAHQTPNPRSQTTKFNPKPHTEVRKLLTEVRKLLTEAEMRARKEKNLSNNCDETVVPGHKLEKVEDEDKAISIKAMAGNTLRMKGKVNGKDVNKLVATGSTHSFVDECMQPLGCKSGVYYSYDVSVADGRKIISRIYCPEFKLEIQGNTFICPVRIIKLGGCDVMLGGDWLREYSPVKFDYENMKITICR